MADPIKPNFSSKQAYLASKKKQQANLNTPLGKLGAITDAYIKNDPKSYQNRPKKDWEPE